MECIICGAVLPENANFCPVCGAACQQNMEQSIPESSTLPEREPVSDIPAMEQASVPDFILMEEIDEADPVVETEAEHDPPEPSFPAPARKRRQALVPVLIMAAMLVVGTVCFFLLPHGTGETPEPTSPVIGNPETQPGLPLPPGKTEDEVESPISDELVPADEACFRMTAEGIVFLPEKYDGGKVLVIPGTIGGKTVTAIAPYGFSSCSGISTIILPNTLETIGEYAFAGCQEIRGIWFPDSMRQIGDGAFRDCIGLESVSVQSGMKSIGKDAFTGCARLFYFFYDGYYEQWLELYNEYVTPYTSVTCLDGDYYHGVKMP